VIERAGGRKEGAVRGIETSGRGMGRAGREIERARGPLKREHKGG
jgi:hypothetical protein